MYSNVKLFIECVAIVCDTQPRLWYLLQGPATLIYLNQVSSPWPTQFNEINLGDPQEITSTSPMPDYGYVSYHNI
jgi:hypothetical protein